VSVIDNFSKFSKLFESLSLAGSGNMTNNEIQKHVIKARNEEFKTMTEFPKYEVDKLVNEATNV